jgi:hypothetical protein
MRRKFDGIGQQIVQHLHHAAFVADEVPDLGIDVDLELDAVGREPILDAFGGRGDGFCDIDGTQLKFHRAGIDGGEIENVIGEREQRVGRFGDVAEIFGLFFRQRAGWKCAKPTMVVSGERNS